MKNNMKTAYWLGNVSLLASLTLTAASLPTNTPAPAPLPDDMSWIMHRIDPTPETETKYGGYNSLAPGDFNKDGFTDYVVIHEFLGFVGVTILFHPGTNASAVYDYWEKVDIYDGNHVEHAAVADFDDDGNLDVAVIGGTEHGETADVRVLWGPDAKDVKKKSAWRQSTSFGGMGTKGGNPNHVVTHDINKDGHPDIFVGGRGISQGSGQMKQIAPDQPYFGLRWAECPDGDYRNVNKWKIHSIDEKVSGAFGFIFTDINQDGMDDIVLTNSDFNTRPEDRALIWYENPGMDKLRDSWPKHVIYQHPEFFPKCRVVATDLNRDGLIDLVVPLGEGNILWFRKTSDKPPQYERIEIAKPYPIKQVQRPLAVGDINEDGTLDIVGGQLHHAYLDYGHQAGYMSPEKWSLYWMEYTGDEPRADNWVVHGVKRAFGSNTGRGAQGEKFDNVKLVDIDGDGDLDIIANSEESYVKKDGEIHTCFGVAWFENAKTRIAASDSFESEDLSGGQGWQSGWEVQGTAKIVPKDIASAHAMELSGQAVVTRSLSGGIDNGQLEFRWMTRNEPRDILVEVYDGAWRFLHRIYPLSREESLPYKNEMLALSKFGPVTRIRITLNGAAQDGILYLDDVVVKERVEKKVTGR